MDRIGKIEVLAPDIRRDLVRLADMVACEPRELRELPQEAGAAEQLKWIVDWLYGNWYTQQPEGDRIDPAANAPPNLRGALDAACVASRQWRRGWVVLQSDPSGVCLAGLGQISRWLYPGQYANSARPGLPPAPGDVLSVNKLVSDYDAATGFWLSQSAGGVPTPPLIRLYFNVGWRNVGRVLAEATSWLEQAAASYSLKYPAAPDATRRVDALVVYFERSHWDELEPAAVALANRLEEHLRPAAPPLTRRLAPGVGCADDPGPGESFGQSRCRALAPAILKLMARKPGRRAAALRELTEALSLASIDPGRPWRVNPS